MSQLSTVPQPAWSVSWKTAAWCHDRPWVSRRSRLLWHCGTCRCSALKCTPLGMFQNKYSETDSTDPNRFQQVKRGREFVPTFLGGHWPARATLLSEPICHMPSPNLVSTGINQGNHDLAVVLSQNGKYKMLFSAGCCTLRTHFSPPFWIRLGNRFDCIYIDQATADSVWHVATLCFGCHRKMWPKRVNQIKPAAHQLTILSLRRPCIGCHSCRHCALFSATVARDEGMHTSTASQT